MLENFVFQSIIILLNKKPMTHWTIPILPLIETILKLNYEDIIPCFHPQYHPKKLYINTYDNYYIRLSPYYFKNYLD